MESNQKQNQNKYEILGVERNADERTIRRAYKNAARESHPDKGGDPEEFKKISDAYQTLSDPDRKAQYDNNLRQQEQRIQQEQEELKQYRAEKTLNSLINQPNEREINRTISSQSDEGLSYLQQAASEKKRSEVKQSKQNAENSPEYQKKLDKYSKEYAEWDDLATLMGSYGDPGPEPTKPNAPNRRISATESKVDSINGKISRELQQRESNREQDLAQRTERLSVRGELGQEPPAAYGQWSSAINAQRQQSQQQSNTRRNNQQDERNNVSEQQENTGRRIRWADDVQGRRGNQLG